MDRGVWQAAVHRAAQTWTRLKRLRTHARTILQRSQLKYPHYSQNCHLTLTKLQLVSITKLIMRRKDLMLPEFPFHSMPQ